MHIHFNRNGLINGRLAIDQINIRHAERIQARENPPVPGRVRAALVDPPPGTQCFVCEDRNTGMDPETTIPPASLQQELVLEVVQTINRFGANRNLFNQANPDPSTLRRVETGPNTGTLVMQNGNTVPMFNGANFANGAGGIAFAPDGTLYDPFTRNGGDLIREPGFYVRLDGTPQP